MREILFRGRRIDNGEWVEGMPWLFKDHACICPWREGMCKYDTGYYPVHVIPETVGQYTGLTNKNGKRIFEGDIVKAMSVPMLVIFDKESAHFFVCYYMDGHKDCFENTLYGHDRLTVIGNIHDNPDLIDWSIDYDM